MESNTKSKEQYLKQYKNQVTFHLAQKFSLESWKQNVDQLRLKIKAARYLNTTLKKNQVQYSTISYTIINEDVSKLSYYPGDQAQKTPNERWTMQISIVDLQPQGKCKIFRTKNEEVPILQVPQNGQIYQTMVQRIKTMINKKNIQKKMADEYFGYIKSCTNQHKSKKLQKQLAILKNFLKIKQFAEIYSSSTKER